MDLFSLGAAGDLGPDAQCIADWVLQSFSLTCSANEWKPQTGAPATHEESDWQPLYSTYGYPACSPACSPGVDHDSPSGMVHSPTAVLPASGINEGSPDGSSLWCHGLEPSRVQIRPNGRNIQVDIDELWLDDLSPRESMAAKAFLSIQQVLLRGKTGQLSVAYCEAHNAARDCALTVLRPRICRRSPSCRGGPSKTVRYSPAVPLHRSCCRSFVTSRG